MEVANAEEFKQRCIESRHEQKHADLLKDAIEHVPAETLDEIRDTMTREARDGSAPTVAPAKIPVAAIREDESSIFAQQAAVTMDHEVKREAKLGIQSMFSSGSIEGPFPGSRSENGLHEALAYFTQAKPNEGSFQVYRPPKSKVGGGSFKG